MMPVMIIYYNHSNLMKEPLRNKSGLLICVKFYINGLLSR